MGKPENSLTSKIIEYITRNRFEWHWRNQVLHGTFKGYWINQGKAGIGDYIVIFPDGKTCYIEIKVPGKKRSKEQIEFADFCIMHNVPYVYAHTVMDVSLYFKEYFSNTKWAERLFYL